MRLEWNGYVVNLIDTPGHVDFGYEVSRSLAACEGVILLVDASQGIEAQTLANCYQAIEHDLTIVAALNKIDLPAAEPDKRAEEIERVLGIPADEVLRISAKTGEGVAELLDAVIERIPPPKGDTDAPLQALMFDSYYDPYRGVISSVRVFNGVLRSGAKLRYLNARQDHDAEEIGVRLPGADAGRDARAGRGRLPHRRHQGRRRGEGRRDRHRRRPHAASRSRATATRSRWCSAACIPSTATSTPTCARRWRSCGSTTRRSRTSPRRRARSGFGFRCGFLGLLHMEIIRERLEREYDLSLVATAPNVEYRVQLTDGERRGRRQPVVDAAARARRGDRRAVRQGHDPHADRVRRHAHGARAAAARRDGEDGVPLRRPRRARTTRCRWARSSSTSSTR